MNKVRLKEIEARQRQISVIYKYHEREIEILEKRMAELDAEHHELSLESHAMRGAK